MLIITKETGCNSLRDTGEEVLTLRRIQGSCGHVICSSITNDSFGSKEKSEPSMRSY